MNAGKCSRARSHASFRREAESHAAPHALSTPILDVGRDMTVRREHIDRGGCLITGAKYAVRSDLIYLLARHIVSTRRAPVDPARGDRVQWNTARPRCKVGRR